MCVLMFMDGLLCVCLSAHRGNERCRVTQHNTRNYLRFLPLMCVQQHSVVCVCGQTGPFASKPLRTVPSLPTAFSLLVQNFYFFHTPCQQTTNAQDKHAAPLFLDNGGKREEHCFCFFCCFCLCLSRTFRTSHTTIRSKDIF